MFTGKRSSKASSIRDAAGPEGLDQKTMLTIHDIFLAVKDLNPTATIHEARLAQPHLPLHAQSTTQPMKLPHMLRYAVGILAWTAAFLSSKPPATHLLRF
jgi:hypothetical protein